MVCIITSCLDKICFTWVTRCAADEKFSHAAQVKQNVQRTLAIELQKLSVQFRKQQKAYLNKLRKTSAASSSFSLLDETGPTARVDEEYDPGFSEIQVCSLPAWRSVRGSQKSQGSLGTDVLCLALPAASFA